MSLVRMDRRAFARLVGASGLGAAAGYLGLGAPPAATAAAAAQFRVSGYRDTKTSTFDAAMQQLMQERNITCGQLAVIRGNKLVVARGYTLDDALPAVEPTTLFRIASLSKPITAVATARLIQDGQLYITSRLPDLVDMTPPPGTSNPPNLQDVYVLRMLRMQGGLTTFGYASDRYIAQEKLHVPLPISRADVIRWGAGEPLVATPGQSYDYSNYSYVLLGQIIENVTAATHTSYEDYVRDEILAPVGITRMKLGHTLSPNPAEEVPYLSNLRRESVFDNNEPGTSVPAPYGGFHLWNWHGSGAWLASAVDYARFMTIMGGTNVAGGDPVLSPSMVSLLTGRPENNTAATYYGGGWLVRPYPDGSNIWHSGGMWGTRTIAVRYRGGATWAVMLNRYHDNIATEVPKYDFEVLNDYIYDAFESVTSWPTYDLSGFYF